MAKEIVSIELDDNILKAKLNNINKQLNENNKVIAKNKAEISSLTKETKELDKAFKQGAISAEEYADELDRNATATSRLQEENRGLSTENKKLSTDFRNLTAIQEQQVGSLNRLRAELSLSLKAYDKLSDEQRDNIEIGGAQLKRINELNIAISKAEQATGRFQRQVGNYAGVGATFAEALKAQGGALGKVTGGVQGFNTALKANPLLAVLTILLPLIQALSKMQFVTDALNVVFGAFNNVLDVLIERVKLFLTLDFVGAFSGLGDAIVDAATAGAQYAKIQKQINDQQQIQNIRNAEAQKQIDILNAQSKDRTKTEAERLAIADEITKIETENFALQKQILATSLDAEDKKVRALLKTKGVQIDLLETTEQLIAAAQKVGLQDESFKKLEEAQIAFTNAERESITLTERISSRRNTILEEENTKKERALEKEKQRKEKELAIQEKYNQDVLNLQNEFTLNERQKLEKSFNDKLNLLVGQGEREVELRKQIVAAQQKALTEFDEKQRQEAFNKLLKDTQEATILEFDIKKQGLLLANAEKEKFDQLTFERQLALFEQEKQLRSLNLEDTIDIDNQILELKAANAARIEALNKAATDNAVALAEKERQAKQNAAQDVFFFVSSLAKRGSAINKAAAFASIITSNAEAVAKGIASAVGVQFPANFPAIASVLGAVGSGISQAKQIFGQADAVQGFATGGLVKSGIPIKRSNGDNVLATLKTGEVVLNKGQQSALGGAGVFRAIGVPGFATGGAVGNTSAIDNNNSLVNQFTDALQDIQIFTAVTDINTGQSNFAKVVERAQV